MAPMTLEDFVARVEKIPTLPMVSHRILNMLEDEDVAFDALADVIEKDQALAVKILKIANSAFYGSFSKIDSIQYALMKLGLGEVKAILRAFSVHTFFSREVPEGFDRQRFWKHAIICSQVARYLGNYFKTGKDDSLFLSGLIHDLGKIIFDQYFHAEFLEIIDAVTNGGQTFSKAEKAIIGYTHYQVSAKLLQKWHFPGKVIMQVFYHHAPWNDTHYPTGSIIVYLANLLTKMSGYTCLETEPVMGLEEFAESKALEFVVKSGFDLDRQHLETLLQNIQEFIQSEGDNMLNFF